MKRTKLFQDTGQGRQLNNIKRDQVNDGAVHRYFVKLSVTGPMSDPTSFEHAIKGSGTYDIGILPIAPLARTIEDLFFDLAFANMRRAADLFRPTVVRTDSVEGRTSLEVSPLLARDTGRTIKAVADLHQRRGKPNLFITIPGTLEGLPALANGRKRPPLVCAVHETIRNGRFVNETPQRRVCTCSSE
jgi:transaldolase